MQSQPSVDQKRLNRKFESADAARAFECVECCGIPEMLHKAVPCGHKLCEACAKTSTVRCPKCLGAVTVLVPFPELSPIIAQHVVFTCRYGNDCSFTTKKQEEAQNHVCDEVVTQWHDRYPALDRDSIVKVLLTSVKSSHVTGEPQSAGNLALTFETLSEMRKDVSSGAAKPNDPTTTLSLAPSSQGADGVRVAGLFIPTSLLVRNRCILWAQQNPHTVAKWCNHFSFCSMRELCNFAHPRDGYMIVDGYPVDATKLVQNASFSKARTLFNQIACRDTTPHDITACLNIHFRDHADLEAHDKLSIPTQSGPAPEGMVWVGHRLSPARNWVMNRGLQYLLTHRERSGLMCFSIGDGDHDIANCRFVHPVDEKRGPPSNAPWPSAQPAAPVQPNFMPAYAPTNNYGAAPYAPPYHGPPQYMMPPPPTYPTSGYHPGQPSYQSHGQSSSAGLLERSIRSADVQFIPDPKRHRPEGGR